MTLVEQFEKAGSIEAWYNAGEWCYADFQEILTALRIAQVVQSPSPTQAQDIGTDLSNIYNYGTDNTLLREMGVEMCGVILVLAKQKKVINNGT